MTVYEKKRPFTERLSKNLSFCAMICIKEDDFMDKKKISKVIAKKAVKVLDASLRVEANTASCVVLYQPKAPDALTKFKRK